jgi:tRNA pseudouridine38-40 synthase
MQRWKLTIEFDGKGFFGWQRQDEGFSVQQVLEEAIFKMTDGQEVRLHAAGRTDSGVHAKGMVAHVDLEKEFTPLAVRNAINALSRPHKVVILKAEKVTDEFHARFSAITRRYRYVICNRPVPLMIGSDYAWHVGKRLDIEKMQIAANCLIGLHDYSAFRAIKCQAKTAIRSIDTLVVSREGDYVYVDVEARSFLHHQIRNITGTLKKIGEGKWPVECMQEILNSKDRTKAGPTAPADGLFFMSVDYPETGNK